MCIGVGSKGEIFVPEPVLHFFERCTFLQQQSSTGVAQIVKTNVAKPDALKQQGKVPCYQIRFDQLPYRIDADKSLHSVW